MLRADRNAAMLAGLICAAAGLKGKAGTVLTESDFDRYNQDPKPPEELTVEKLMKVLGRKG
jgi:hypothetical protein